MEPNPLEITTTEAKSTTNKRGRPVNADSIKFSCPQPKSAIIAQILREKSLKQSIEETEQSWQTSATFDDNFQMDEEVQNFEIKVEDVLETNPKRFMIKQKSVKKPKKSIVPKDKEEKLFACDFPDCSYAAKLSCNLVKHKRKLKPKKSIVPKDKEEKRFACDFPDCSYAAKLSCNLVKHKRRHTSEKPYICDACPFRTNFINSLKVHRRIHTAEKPYNCEHCGYRCNTSSNLKKHKMHRHPEVAKI